MGEESKLRILLVEDHADTAMLLAKLLERAKHQVKTALTKASAEALAEKETFDLLISDLTLPDGSGLDLMRGLKARFKLKGIALTGHSQAEDLRLSQEAGFEAHLTKPIDFKRFLDTIARLTTS